MKCEMSEVKWEQSGILIRIGSRYAVHSTHIAHTNNHQSRTDIESHQRANSSGKFAYVRSWLQKKTHCKFTHSFVLYMNECNSCIYSTNHQFRTLQEPTQMQNGKKRNNQRIEETQIGSCVCVSSCKFMRSYWSFVANFLAMLRPILITCL